VERVLLQGLAMGLFLGLGALIPREKNLGLIHKDLWINLLTGAALFIGIAPVMRWVAEQLELHLFLWSIDSVVVQFLLVFVLLDFVRYWLHFAHHRIPFLWFFHRVHHSTEHLDATAGLRMHAVDFVQLSLLPILLFGVFFDIRGFNAQVLPTALMLGVFLDAFQHANIKMDMSRPWNRCWHLFFNNPHFHVWHHTREGSKIDGNYGNCLLIWDRLFGTDVTQKEPPTLLGVCVEDALRNDPIGLQLLRPLP